MSSRIWVAFIVVVLGSGWTSSAHADALPSRAAYVTNSDDDTVSVISLATRQVIATINVGDYPLGVAVTPDAQRVYVTNWLSNSVSVIDATVGGVVTTITQGIGVSPGAIAVSPDGNRVYVANYNEGGNGSISVIDTETNKVVGTPVSTSPKPYALACHPVRDELWVGYNTGGRVLEARSAGDLSVLAKVDSSNRAYASHDIVFRADGSEAFGAEACGECGRFHRISGTLSDGSISILEQDILYGTPPGYGHSVAINPHTGVAYLGKGRSAYQGTNPRIVEFAGQGRTLEFDYDDAPTDIAFEPEDRLIYVVRQTRKEDTPGSVIPPGSVSIVDPDTLLITATVNVGRWPSRIALGLWGPANQDPIADAGADQTVSTGPQHSVTVTLDGTGSTDPDGDTLEYLWTAPDESPVVVASPQNAITTATIPATTSGDYPILLTVTDGEGGVDTDDVVIHVVVDDTPPEITCSTDKVSLWPPNHQIVEVALCIEVSDGTVTAECTSSEPDDANGDGSYTGDVNGEDGFTSAQPIVLSYQDGRYVGTVRLRAERDGSETGRTYTIVCTATDAYGNSATARCAVVVPHDRRKN